MKCVAPKTTIGRVAHASDASCPAVDGKAPMVKSRLQGAVLMAALGVAAAVPAAVAFAGTRGGLRGSPRSAKALHNQALIVAGGSPVPRLAPERTARAIEPHPDAPG